MESYYVLNDLVTDESLRDFLRNFTKNSLNRALSSKEQKRPMRFDLSTCENENYFCIQELDSDMFIPRISRVNKVGIECMPNIYNFQLLFLFMLLIYITQCTD